MSWLGLSLLAAVLWGLQYALWGQALRGISPLVGMWWYCLFSFLFYSLLLGIKGVPLEMEKIGGNWQLASLLVGLAILGFMANVTMLSGFAVANPTVVTMVTASSPMFTAMFAYLLFKNVDVNLTMVVGFVLILAGVSVVAWSKQ